MMLFRFVAELTIPSVKKRAEDLDKAGFPDIMDKNDGRLQYGTQTDHRM